MAVHFLHIGKTGGTAIRQALTDAGLPDTPYGRVVLHEHGFRLSDVPGDDYVFFVVRDPVDRFVSAFYSRLRRGQPRYFFEWSDAEREAFGRFATPEALASALAGDDPEDRAAAAVALRRVKHMQALRRMLVRPTLLEERSHQILFIGRQECLDADWLQIVRLLALPVGARLPRGHEHAHRSDPSLDRALSATAVAVLRGWYASDYDLIRACDRMRARNGWGAAPPPRASTADVAVRPRRLRALVGGSRR